MMKNTEKKELLLQNIRTQTFQTLINIRELPVTLVRKFSAHPALLSISPQFDPTISHLYFSTLKPLVGVQDTYTNGNNSCAPM